jgi:hypothetical protein
LRRSRIGNVRIVGLTTVLVASISLTQTCQASKVNFQNKGKFRKFGDSFQKPFWTQQMNKIDIFSRRDLSIFDHVSLHQGAVTLGSIILLSKPDDSSKSFIGWFRRSPKVKLFS